MPRISRTEAVRLIAKLWRCRGCVLTTRKLVDSMRERGPTTSRVISLGFNELVSFLKEQPAIDATKACLQRIHMLCGFRHGSEAGVVNVRMFMAAFMIAHFPSNVFEAMGEQERKLYGGARALVESFERICGMASRSFQDVPYAATRDFQSLLLGYLRDFKAWKATDSTRIVERMEHALRALYTAIEVNPDDGALRAMLERMRDKLVQVAGPEALRKVDLARLEPGYVDARVSGEQTRRYSTEELAHELFLDPGFRLTDRLDDLAHSVFWAGVADDLALQPPSYGRAMMALKNVRDGIVEVAPPSDVIAMAAVLDLDFIQQRAMHGLFTWDDCAELVSAVAVVIRRAQNPSRDAEFSAGLALVHSEADPAAAFCKGLRFLACRVQALRVDSANARLRLIAPLIRERGAEYERGKFQDKLADGTLTLERTAAWLRGNNRDVAEGMLALVTGAWPVCPETLLMDVERIGEFQRDFAYAVSASVAVARSAQCNVAERLAAALLSQPDIVEAVLSVAGDENVGRICAQNGDAVFVLMRQRVLAMYRAVLQGGQVQEGVLAPLVGRLAGKVAHLLACNRAVHADTYRGIE